MSSAFALTYGEDTHLSPNVRSAHLLLHLVPSQRLALLEASFIVVNDSVGHAIEASLRFPLPSSDSVVCGFAVGTDRAIAVPKAKVAAVAYKEKEKKRAVATAVSVQAMYTTTVYPLPPKEDVRLTVQCVCPLEAAADDASMLQLHLPLSFATAVPRVTTAIVVGDEGVGDGGGVEVQGGDGIDTTLADGVRLRVRAPPPSASPIVAAVGRNGKLHWAGCVPATLVDAAFAKQASPAQAPPVRTTRATRAATATAAALHVALLVDSSRSAAPMAAPTRALVKAIDVAARSQASRPARTLQGPRPSEQLSLSHRMGPSRSTEPSSSPSLASRA